MQFDADIGKSHMLLWWLTLREVRVWYCFGPTFTARDPAPHCTVKVGNHFFLGFNVERDLYRTDLDDEMLKDWLYWFSSKDSYSTVFTGTEQL